ncbi:P2X purinoceptor [Pyxidicoccus xibeiensis]|uniref:P2X purinoceptor n=1 Tax=Pyxidicoccus xibeiensis TaxID=2906759 RepID=UPI0020A7C2E5|nr:P2X purinoceptor [Pyxidicoccus xibeiensis]MCP3137507.1 P2X purinoceptor [Pyxidicoccus xibeiensis]
MRRMLMVMVVLAAGCSSGLGEPCDAQTACPDDLVCSFAQGEDGPASLGVCDYPLRGEGGACTVAAECERSLTCSNHFTPGDRYGTCVKKLADGAACFTDRDCQGGTCEGASGSALDGVCTSER